MTAKDYEVMLMLHLVDMADCTNARFVWMRVPEALQKDADLALAWKICQALQQQKFKEVFDLLKGKESPLQKLLKEVLTKIFIPDLVFKSFAAISRPQLMEMLGVTTDALLSKCLDQRYIVTGTKFVTLKLK